MAAGDDQMGVVITLETAEEASRCLSSLTAGGFRPILDPRAGIDRLAKFPVLVRAAQLDEAQAFIQRLQASRAARRTAAQATAATPQAQAREPALAKLLPTAGRAIALVTGLLVVAGGVMVLASMLQFLNSLRNH